MAFVPAPGPALSARPSARAPVCLRGSALHGARVARRAVVPARAAGVRMALGQSMLECLEATKAHPTLLKLAAAAGLDLGAISGTLFAPTEAAFARLAPGVAEALLARPADLRMLLAHHLVPERYTVAQIKGVGYFEGVAGGPLPYEALGPITKIGAATIQRESSNRECDNGIIHAIDTVVFPKCVSVSSAEAAVPPKGPVGDSTAFEQYPPVPIGRLQKRALGAAAAPSTTGGRKAMGLISQLPFWMYGPPYLAAKQEDYEPISIAQPEFASVDYQQFPPEAVIVVPDALSAAKLIPVSGFSKYTGQMKRIKGGDAESDYSRLD